MRTETDENKRLSRLTRKVAFYSWSIQANTITADKTFAEFYEISDEDLVRGVAVEHILSLIVEDDRARLAERIHDVLLGGPPALSLYRIRCPSGEYKSLVSIGSCSRDEDGLPVTYSGIVMPAEDPQGLGNEGEIEDHISSIVLLAEFIHAQPSVHNQVLRSAIAHNPTHIGFNLRSHGTISSGQCSVLQ